LGGCGWLDDSVLAGDMEIIAGDVTDPESVRAAMTGVDTVLHLAALIAIPYSYQAPRSYLRTNAEGTLNVLLAARDAGVRRIVHTSTSEVYGTAQRVPIDEEHPLRAQSPYAASKIAGDKLAESFACSFDLPVVTVRPFNTFGPRQSSRAVLPTIITQCLAIQRGEADVIRLGSTTPTRDLNYVEDTAAGFLAAAVAGEGCHGATLNLGTGREVSVGDIAQSIAGIVGVNPRIETDARRVRPSGSEVERLIADANLARDVLGWAPSVGLEEGLRRTVAWFAERVDATARAHEYVV
ncbi:MAG: GDP-mannose 4,6-dehydratase, partial [Planctomycetota bacterium]